MKRVLLTGMSGTGKSTVVRELKARGHRAVDADEPGWSELRSPAPAEPEEWLWVEARVAELLSSEEGEVLFFSGCAANQGRFYPRFDAIVLLSAPPEVLIERLATRTTNDFGKDPAELAQILEDQRTVEPLLRRRATLEVDSTAPLEEVVAAILSHAGQPARGFS